MDAAALLTEIVDHFAKTGENPGDWWAHCDDYTSYSLDHTSKDGTKFWIDLDKDGTITLLWKSPGQEKAEIKQFHADWQRS